MKIKSIGILYFHALPKLATPPSTPQFGQLDPFISARHNNILLVWYWYDMIRYDNDDNNDDCNDSYDDVDDNFGI